jgi:hypothetical protein
MIGFDRAGPPGSRPLAQDVARAPYVQELALAGSVDAGGHDPALHRAEIAIDQRDAPATERVAKIAQGVGPPLRENRALVDAIKDAG